MITQEFIELTWNPSNKKIFIDKSYKFTKYGDKFVVDIKDLNKNSCYKVECKCDFCGQVFMRMYYLVANREKHSCNKCKGKLQKETNLKKYGCACVLQNEEIVKKTKKTLMDKYKTDSVCKSKEVIEKRKKTFKEHFSDKTARKDLQTRKENTRKANTGYETPFHDPLVKEKSKQTIINRYGVDNVMKSEEVLEQIAFTKYKNNSIRTSKEQKHIHNLIGGELNYPIGSRSGDIVFVEEKIVFEYDGGGHFRFCERYKENAEEDQLLREQTLYSKNYKTIHMINHFDRLYSDDIIKMLVSLCKKILNTTDDLTISINVDDSEISSDSFFCKLDYEGNVLYEVMK